MTKSSARMRGKPMVRSMTPEEMNEFLIRKQGFRDIGA